VPVDVGAGGYFGVQSWTGFYYQEIRRILNDGSEELGVETD